jgi:hypothetical protein
VGRRQRDSQTSQETGSGSEDHVGNR